MFLSSIDNVFPHAWDRFYRMKFVKVDKNWLPPMKLPCIWDLGQIHNTHPPPMFASKLDASSKKHQTLNKSISGHLLRYGQKYKMRQPRNRVIFLLLLFGGEIGSYAKYCNSQELGCRSCVQLLQTPYSSSSESRNENRG